MCFELFLNCERSRHSTYFALFHGRLPPNEDRQGLILVIQQLERRIGFVTVPRDDVGDFTNHHHWLLIKYSRCFCQLRNRMSRNRLREAEQKKKNE